MVGDRLVDQLRLPGGLVWKKGALKYLGVFLGNEMFLQKNWDNVLEKVKGRLMKWKWLLPKMSYRGRVLVINNLVSSALWHRLACVDPPASLLSQIQRVLVDFFFFGTGCTGYLRACCFFLRRRVDKVWSIWPAGALPSAFSSFRDCSLGPQTW